MQPSEMWDWPSASIDYSVDRMEVDTWIRANKTGHWSSFPVMDTSDVGMHFRYTFEKEADAVAFKLKFPSL